MEMQLTYSETFSAHLADKPMLLDGVEKSISVTHTKFKVCDPFEDKLPKAMKHPVYFNFLQDRKIWVALQLFTLDNDECDDDDYKGEWGYQLVLKDKGDHYRIEYQDGFITGDARGGDDFQELTAAWQW